MIMKKHELRSEDPASKAGAWRASIRRHLLVGAVVVVSLTGGIGGWAATTKLAGAVIAQGTLVVDSNVKKVQHQTGGIVGELRVHDGDRVAAGDIVVRLDDTVTRANLAIVSKGLDESVARQARLESERDGIDFIIFPDNLIARADDADVAHVMASESKLANVRRTARIGQKEQLRRRIEQFEEEARGDLAQRDAKTQELDWIERELVGISDLYRKNLIPFNRLTQLQREKTRLEGERAQLIAATAQVKGKISETQLQIIQIDENLSSDVAKELRETEDKIGEFVERKVTAEDQLKRIDIRAPQDGTVFQLAVHTVGGVISPGDTIMLVVPDTDRLIVEAKVNPQDIDHLQIGQKAMLRLSAFNQRTTPEIAGIVKRIAADVATDQRTGQTYYVARIALPSDELAALGDVKLVPGMPVECFILTSERTVISYLMKPLRDQLKRTMAEN
jgi:HlyD family secretion protein